MNTTILQLVAIYRVILSLEVPNAIRQEIQAVNVDTVGKVFQNLEKSIHV